MSATIVCKVCDFTAICLHKDIDKRVEAHMWGDDCHEGGYGQFEITIPAGP